MTLTTRILVFVAAIAALVALIAFAARAGTCYTTCTPTGNGGSYCVSNCY